MNGESLFVETLSVTGGTGHINVGKELHFNFLDAVALALFAASAFDIEAESSGSESADFGIGKRCEQVSDCAEGFRVSDGIRARGAPDGALVDHDCLVHIVEPGNAFVRTGDCGVRHLEFLFKRGAENAVHQGAFAGAGNAGYTAERSEREIDRHVFQVVVRHAFQPDRFSVAFFAFRRNLDLEFAGEILSCQGAFGSGDFIRLSRGNDFAAVHTGARTEVQHIVGGADGVHVMLHHDDRVADIAEPFERGEQFVIIPLMESDTRFVRGCRARRPVRSRVESPAGCAVLPRRKAFRFRG